MTAALPLILSLFMNDAAAEAAVASRAERPRTLVIMAAGSTQERKQLQPALDALCATFDRDVAPYRDVVCLNSDTDLTAILGELTVGAARTDKGALVRQIQGGMKAHAFQSCRDRHAPVALTEPLEVVLFGISYGAQEEANVSVSRYEVNAQVAPLDRPFNAHVKIFRDLEILGECVGHRFWDNGKVDDDICAKLRFASADDAVSPNKDPPLIKTAIPPVPIQPLRPPPSRWWSRWWMWTGIGAIALGGTIAIVAASRGRADVLYPPCPEPYKCGGR